MRKLLIGAVVLLLVMLMSSAVLVYADQETILEIKVKLPGDQSQWEMPGEICITKQGMEPADVINDSEMIVLQFFKKNEDALRVGIKEFSSPGLLVRIDLKLSEIKDGELTMSLKRAGDQWKMFANGLEVNNINWNIAVPEGLSKEEFRKTDNIYYCTDYSLPNEASGSSIPESNGLIEFLKDFPTKIQITQNFNGMAFEVVEVKGDRIAQDKDGVSEPKEDDAKAAPVQDAEEIGNAQIDEKIESNTSTQSEKEDQSKSNDEPIKDTNNYIPIGIAVISLAAIAGAIAGVRKIRKA